MVHGTRDMVHGTLLHCTWYMVHYYTVHGTLYMEHGAQYTVRGTRYMVHSTCYMYIHVTRLEKWNGTWYMHVHGEMVMLLLGL